MPFQKKKVTNVVPEVAVPIIEDTPQAPLIKTPTASTRKTTTTTTTTTTITTTRRGYFIY